MRPNLSHSARGSSLSAAAAMFLFTPCVLAQNARDSGQDAARAKLGKTVHLNLGPTTIEKVMAALSEQTGLTIKAADYLRERKIIVRMDNLSASAALDALNELNDWTWYPTLPDQILVTRRRLRVDAVPAAIPRVMQAAIPKDIRTYLSIPTPSDNMAAYVSGIDDSLYRTMTGFKDRLHKSVATDQAKLLNSLAPGILTGEPVAFTRLTEEQRSELLVTLVFPLLRMTDYQLLHGDALPHVADVNNAVLKLSGNNGLLVGSFISDGKTDTEVGFGATIK